jgi:hypothetical protein
MLPKATVPDYVTKKINAGFDFLASVEASVDEILSGTDTDAILVERLQALLGRLRYHLSQVAIDCACGQIQLIWRPDYEEGRKLEEDLGQVIKKMRGAL